MERRRPVFTARRSSAVIASTLALAVIFAGCSSSSVPGDGGGSDSGDASEGTIAVTISRGTVNIENAILADEQGFFEQEGLDIGEMKVGGIGGAAQNSALVAGEFDIGATDAVTAVRAINEGIPIVVVAGTKSANPDYEGDVSDGLVVPAGSAITSWSDLTGKKIGVPELGGLPHLTVMTALEENGIDEDEVELVPLPLDALVPAAANGQIDAVFTFSIFMLSALDAGFTRVGTGVREFLPYAPQSLWIATKEFADENPEAVKRFRNGLALGTEYGNENPDAVRQVYHDYTELPAPFIDNVMILEPLDVEFNKQGWDDLLQAMKDVGEIKDDLTYEDIVWEGAR